MAQDPVCPECSERIPPGEADCPYCAQRKPYPFLHRDPVLFALVLALAVVLWLVTHGATQAYGHRQDQLARTWYATGDAALRAGKLPEAISDLRTALAYAHDDASVRLRLAEALAAAGQLRQAQAYLLALWEEQPANGTFNLELARLAVRRGDVADAQRYYHGAIYGVWSDDPIARRRNVRLELIEFLLARRAPQEAESELIALSADMPPDPQWRLEAGTLFLKTGDAHRALAMFRDVVAREPKNAVALAGAGQSAFESQDYVRAQRYLSRAVALDPNDRASAQTMKTAELVLQLDPFAARIGRDERARRVLRAVEQTQYRLEKCAEQKHVELSTQPTLPIAADYAQLLAIKPRATAPTLRDDADLVDEVMDIVFRSQTDAAAACGQPQGADAALLLIARASGALP